MLRKLLFLLNLTEAYYNSARQKSSNSSFLLDKALSLVGQKKENYYAFSILIIEQISYVHLELCMTFSHERFCSKKSIMAWRIRIMIIILHIKKVRGSQGLLIVILINKETYMKFGRNRKVQLNVRRWEEGGR